LPHVYTGTDLSVLSTLRSMLNVSHRASVTEVHSRILLRTDNGRNAPEQS